MVLEQGIESLVVLNQGGVFFLRSLWANISLLLTTLKDHK